MKTKPFLKSMALVICCLTSFVLVSCDKDDDKPNLKISPNKVEVAVGKTVTVSVSNGTAPYTTKSSDAKIAVAKSDKNAIVIFQSEYSSHIHAIIGSGEQFIDVFISERHF